MVEDRSFFLKVKMKFNSFPTWFVHLSKTSSVFQVSSLSESEESQDSSDSIGSSQKTHGILARHPSYRKILKDLSSEDTRGRKGDGENPGVSAVTSMSVPTPIYQTSTGQYSMYRRHFPPDRHRK